MGEILDTVISFFNSDGWSYTLLEGRPIVRLLFEGQHAQWACYAQAREEAAQFIFFSVCPVKVLADRRLLVAEYLTRANYGLFVGNFELDFEDGEVRFKTSIDFEGDRLTPTLVRRLVYLNVLMMDRYLPGLMKVAYGEESPTVAIAAIEESR